MIRTIRVAALAAWLALAPIAVLAADQTPLKPSTGAVPHPVTFGTGDTVGVANGGTGLASLTNHCVVVGQGTSAAHLVCPGTSGLPLTSAGASSDPAFSAIGCSALPALTGDVTTSPGACSTTIGASTVTLAKIANAAASSKLVGSGASGSGSAYSEITLGAGLTMTGTTLSASGSVSGANPTATAGPTAVNGSASTFMRSDGAPAIQLGTNSVPGLLQGDGATTNVSAGVVSVVGTPVGSSYSAPSLASFTWVNQGTSTATQTVSGGSILMGFGGVAGLNWRGLFLTPPATPYKVVVQTKAFFANQNTQAAGLYFYDGTKLLGIETLYAAANSVTLRVERITNVTTDNSTVDSSSLLFGATNQSSSVWWQERDDGTTLYFDISADGVNFVNFYSEAVGAFITPTKVGWGAASVTTTSGISHYLLNWHVYANANLN